MIPKANDQLSRRQKGQVRLRSLIKTGATGRASELKKMINEANDTLSHAFEAIEVARRQKILPDDAYQALVKGVLDMMLMASVYIEAIRTMQINLDQRFGKTRDTFGTQSQIDANINQMNKVHAPKLMEGVIETIDYYKKNGKP